MLLQNKIQTSVLQYRFFSKVSLKNVVSRLSLMGYKYSICGVPFTYVDPQKEEKKLAKKQRKSNHGNE